MKAWLVGLLMLTWIGAHAAPVRDDFPWREWGDAAFAEAQRDGKFVLLSLQGWWCEPCHRMNSVTYASPEVRAYIEKHYVPIYVDQDSRPDISQRFERWGWPATVLFAADGTEIVKLRGFYSPQFFMPVLTETVADPSPVDYGRLGGPERGLTLMRSLPDERRAFLVDFFDNKAYDEEFGGWGNRMKLIDGPTLDYALERARAGAAGLQKRVRAQLDGMIRMVDERTGARGQLARRDWSHTLAEYPMFAQEGALRGFAVGYRLFQEPGYRAAAQKVYGFLRDHLSAPNGGVYTSMGRESFNPGVDKRRYARETGKAIAAILAYYDATADGSALALARKYADWALKERALAGGGFSHAAKDSGGPFLADNLEMARALLHLHRSSGERRYLQAAEQTAGFMIKAFVDPDTGGFLAAARPAGGFMPKAVKLKDDNVLATRFFNHLHAYTGEARYRAVAEGGMGYLASDAVLEAFWFLPGVLQAESELGVEPLHLTVVGAKSDAAAKLLYQVALAYPAIHKRVEWWDKAEGPLRNPDVRDPKLPRAAAFACSGSVCSLPVFKPAAVAKAAERLGNS